jgi:hypothetical protein
LSGDPERMRHYLTPGRRNKSHDRVVLAAIREGMAVDADRAANTFFVVYGTETAWPVDKRYGLVAEGTRGTRKSL